MYTKVVLTEINTDRMWVFGERLLRKIFGSKWSEIIGHRKLHNGDPHSFYSSPNIIRMIKLRRMRWAVHVA
jgi:hypothetical protein